MRYHPVSVVQRLDLCHSEHILTALPYLEVIRSANLCSTLASQCPPTVVNYKLFQN